MTESVRVVCRRNEDGWACSVSVGTGSGATSHEVIVSPQDLKRLAGGATDPSQLVAASFEFLLERESKYSILRRFDLAVIARYFPEYPDKIIRRLTR